ncbi:hypothetical protein GCU56_14240 [Geodermatophilus sabuli]|uniref:Uncharacterized protein n=1 Tax=Geodermatophilus sabuli TaxID=1564158 RepID=A0A7K3W5B8_9ACTN|nr:hypothetical protein [Geodermatophilus sabuli]
MSPSPSPPPAARLGADTSVRCPGCGCVLVPARGDDPAPAGVSAACTRLFEETLRGLREEVTDAQVAVVVALADGAYAAQHPGATGPQRLAEVLDDLAGRLAEPVPTPPGDVAEAPEAWRTTIADVAADLDVIDLPVLVETWARAVLADWRREPTRMPDRTTERS